MKNILYAAVLAATCAAAPVLGATAAPATTAKPLVAEPLSAAPEGFRFAVIGDWPYNDLLLNNANLLVDSINADRSVQLVIHVGDIHSGSQPCTSAGILPPIATSNPGWNQQVFQQFQKMWPPVVYTPGDNEWTDCHKSKEFASGDPLKELAAVRGLFFSRPGLTLGMNEMEVMSQADFYDPAHPEDAQYVENVIFWQGNSVFVTLNVPGSNNDTVAWTGPFGGTDAAKAAQANEVATRNAANSRWMAAAFALAERQKARAVIVAIQADMFDPAALAPGGDGLSAYMPFVKQLADLSVHYGGPVLLLNGDSHLYESDRPLADIMSPTFQIHGTQPVPNLTRITVQGSTNAPAEWLRVEINDPVRGTPFSWKNFPYCKDPTKGC
jgi:hypothetical protein